MVCFALFRFCLFFAVCHQCSAYLLHEKQMSRLLFVFELLHVFLARAVCKKRCDFKVNSSASAMPIILRWGLTSWIPFPVPPASIHSPHLCHAHYITLGTEEQPDVLQNVRCTGGLPLFGSTAFLSALSVLPWCRVFGQVANHLETSWTPLCYLFPVAKLQRIFDITMQKHDYFLEFNAF